MRPLQLLGAFLMMFGCDTVNRAPIVDAGGDIPSRDAVVDSSRPHDRSSADRPVTDSTPGADSTLGADTRADLGPSKDASSGAVLLFSSGFENQSDICNSNGVKTPPCATEYTCGANYILTGADGSFSWPTDLPGMAAKNYFNDVIKGTAPDCCATGCLTKSLLECHEIDVVSTTGHTGKPTKALYYKTKKNCSQHAISRLQYNMKADHKTGQAHDQFNPIYFRVWLRFQSSVASDMSKGSWRQVWEFYYQKNDWSNELLVVNTGSGLKWRLGGRFYAPAVSKWFELSTKNVPTGGKWFLLETYLKSHPTNGAILVKVDGKVIFDLKGPSYPTARRLGQEPETAAMLKMYTNRWGQEQWMDDLEIWTGIP